MGGYQYTTSSHATTLESNKSDTFTFSAHGTHVTGTITLRTFALQDDPLNGGGTVLGEFTFTGTLVTP